MTELITSINTLFENFKTEATKNANGNKAAGIRARKVSLEIEKALKEYRKVSIENDKA